jgi:hypothetical protein
MSATPRATAIALVATLAVLFAALASFAGGAPIPTDGYLVLFIVLFAGRVVGQIGVAVARPGWLPPMEQWNFVPYRVLLPVQLVILALMVALVLDAARLGGGASRALIVCALVYWAAMTIRYGVRMARRPTERWLGGTIPIVFHCVLAAFLFVLGASHSGWA